MSQIVCPKHLSVYMRGSIPDRYTADPTIDPTDDECLRDIGFTDVSDGTTEDDIIALIDDGPEDDVPEAVADCGSDEVYEDAYETFLDDLADAQTETEIAAAHLRHYGRSRDALVSILRRPAVTTASFPKTACVKTAGNRLLDIEDRNGNDSGFIGSRRHAYAVLGQDIFENRMTSRRCNRTHSDSWKRNKVAKQYLRHEGRQTE
jgi:hypothetical protein